MNGLHRGRTRHCRRSSNLYFTTRGVGLPGLIFIRGRTIFLGSVLNISGTGKSLPRVSGARKPEGASVRQQGHILTMSREYSKSLAPSTVTLVSLSIFRWLGRRLHKDGQTRKESPRWGGPERKCEEG